MTRSTGTSGLILFGIAAERDHRVAHRGEIDDRRHAGEILHQHPRRAERDFVLMFAAIVGPRGDRLDVFLLDAASVFVAQQVFEHDLERERKLRDAGEPVLLRRLQRVNLIGLRPHGQRLAALETVEAGHAGAPGRKAIGGGSAGYRYNSGGQATQTIVLEERGSRGFEGINAPQRVGFDDRTRRAAALRRTFVRGGSGRRR